MQSLVQQQKRDGAAMRSDVGKAIREIDNRITALDTVFALYQQHFKDAFSFMSREIRVSEEHVGNIVRNELRRQLRPLVEEILTKSEIQNSAMLEHFRVLIDDAATEILKCIASEGDRKEQLTTRDTNSTPSQHHSANAEQHPQHSMMARPATQEHTNSLDTDPASLARASRTWCSTTKHSYQANIPYIGSFRVEYRTHEERKGRFCTFRIDFWPSTIFLLRRSISLKYSTRPDIQGMSVSMLHTPGATELLSSYSTKVPIPHKQPRKFSGLVCYAQLSYWVLFRSGQDSLNALLTREIATTFIIPPCYDRRFVSMAKHFESFCTTFHSMVALGCDLEDCEFTICDHHLDPKFSKLPFDCRKRDRQENDPKEAVSESDSISMIHGSSTQSQCEDTDDEAQEDYLGSIRRLAGFLNLQGFDLLHNSGNSDV
ncbi:hypothetical protein N0V84_004191 [Fusarium piperis]|uniref:Uncharacterized protein n=1 Tax=Fusarium piperis TaxID=1435070 RepID=A0A9W8WG08_9HYPO|nr:hypothetical protein N0V84_004191 [Fusarium piperis]